MSGLNAAATYMEDGEGDPELCVSVDKTKCKATDEVCVGKQETNFVYTLDTEERRRSKIPTEVHNARASRSLSKHTDSLSRYANMVVKDN